MQVRTSDGISVVGLHGTFGVECGDGLHRTLVDLLESGQRVFIADLLGVTRLDAAGVGELVRAFTLVRGKGGEIAVVVGRDQVRELLDLTRLTTFVPTFESVAEAAASLAPCGSC
jgi:anti-anti-sigma factor